MVIPVPIADAIREVYRRLHRRPELGLELPETVETIVRSLDGLPLEVRRGSRVDSLVAVLRGPEGGPVTVLRADTDALPVQEDVEHDLRSEIDGVMHACGHDAHAAMLVGAAHLLSGAVDELPGPVVFVWQPGEEGHEGMAAMLEEGLLELVGGLGRGARTFGLHLLSDPELPAGVFTGRAGPSHASTATFEVVFRGRGGHAAFPHLALDPIPPMADFIATLNAAASRARDPFEPAVITVGSVAAGDASNVIAEEAALSGTFRAYSRETAARISGILERVAGGVADVHGVDVSTAVRDGYPAVVNDTECVEQFASAIEARFGAGRFHPMEHPLPAGDDYARLLEAVPGAFFMLGAGIPDGAGVMRPNHSSCVRFDESVLPDGAEALAAVVLDRKGEHR